MVLMLRLFQTSRRFNVEIQPQLVLSAKTLPNIEGLGRQLDPDLDSGATAKTFSEQWMLHADGGPQRLVDAPEGPGNPALRQTGSPSYRRA